MRRFKADWVRYSGVAMWVLLLIDAGRIKTALAVLLGGALLITLTPPEAPREQ